MTDDEEDDVTDTPEDESVPGARGGLPPDVQYNSRGEPINLADAPGQQISAAQVTPDRMRAMAAANAAPPTTSTTSSDGTTTNTTDFPLPSGTRGQGGSAMPAVQSEPTPAVKKPPIDPRPYAWLAKNNPDLKSTIDQAAEMTGVSPERIAWHAWKESRLNPHVGRGGDGEIGMMQILPSTAKTLSMGGRLDPFDPHDNILMGALYMRDLDAKYGQDSLLSVAHYNGSGPKAIAYGKSAFPGASFSENELTAMGRGGSATPQGLFDAAKQGGPDGFLRYVVDTAPSGMNMSDAWRHAEGLLVNAMIRKGDIAGAQHARDFIFQLSQTGTNQYLMAAHQALQRGDGVAAAQYLAKSHAFFPDGTIGRFRSDGKNVYAERIDENDPSRRLGPPMAITANDVAGLLNQTTDPQQYLKTLNEQQKTAAMMRMYQTHGDYYAALTGKIPQQLAIQQGELALGQQKASDANARAAMSVAAANQRAADRNATTLQAAQVRAGNNQTAENAYQKEANDIYNPQMNPDDPLIGRKSAMYVNMRRAGITGPQSQVLTQGIANGDLQVRMSPDRSQAAVFDKAGKPIQYLPTSVISQLSGTSVPQQRTAMPMSPIGAIPSPTPSSLGGAPPQQ